MGKISDTSKYPIVAPSATDIIIGTDVGSSDATKNFTVQSIADLSAAYVLSNTGTGDSLATIQLSDGTNTSNIGLTAGTGLTFSTNSTNAITLDLSVPITTAQGGTGLTAIGSAGQVLKVNAGGTALEWGATAGSGTVTGTGTAFTLPMWSIGGTGIQDSPVSSSGTSVTANVDNFLIGEKITHNGFATTFMSFPDTTTGGTIYFQLTTDGTDKIRCGQYDVDLYYNGASKLTTKNTGVQVKQGLLDTSGASGTEGQVLSSLGSSNAVSWVNAGAWAPVDYASNTDLEAANSTGDSYYFLATATSSFKASTMQLTTKELPSGTYQGFNVAVYNGPFGSGGIKIMEGSNNSVLSPGIVDVSLSATGSGTLNIVAGNSYVIGIHKTLGDAACRSYGNLAGVSTVLSLAGFVTGAGLSAAVPTTGVMAKTAFTHACVIK